MKKPHPLIEKIADNDADSELDTHSFRMDGRISTLRLEKVFWDKIKDIAEEEKKPFNEVVTDIVTEAKAFNSKNMASSVRVYLMARMMEDKTPSNDFEP